MDKFDAIIEDLKNNRQPQICSCYHTRTERHYYTDYERGFNSAIGIKGDYEDREIPECWGTREKDVCSCKGDMCKCDFYEDIRKKAKIAYAKGRKARMEKIYHSDEHEELLFYRQWILDHDLLFEVLNDYEKYKKLKSK